MTETTDPQAEFTAADLIAALRSAGEERDKLHRKELSAVERIRENADFHLGQEMARRQLAEKETARLRAVVARLRQMTDHWEQQLPEVIRTPAVVSAIRAVLERAETAPSPPADRAAILREAAERVTGHAADHFPDEYDDYADQLAAELRRMADEAPGPDRCSACRYIPCDNCRPAAAGSAVAGHTGDEAAHREPVNPCTRGNNFCGQHGYDCPPDEPAAGLPAGGAPHTKEA